MDSIPSTSPALTTLDADTHRIAIGTSIGKYTILEHIGQGGTGSVYRAHDPHIRRDVALKILLDERRENIEDLQRLHREAHAVGKISHPNIVHVFDLFEYEDRLVLIMELVQGEDLNTKVQSTGPLSADETLRIALQLCDALTRIHSEGLIHRDIKPANIICQNNGQIKLADFGLVKGEDLLHPLHTNPERVVGTPHFMSPEQCNSAPVDARSDLYALGATLFFLITGHTPYERSLSPIQVLFAHTHRPVPDPCEINPHVPPLYRDIIRRLMAKDPDARYQHAHSLKTALQETLSTVLSDTLTPLDAALTSNTHLTPTISTPKLPPPPQPKPSSVLLWTTCFIASLALLVATFFALNTPTSTDNTDSAELPPHSEISPTPTVAALPANSPIVSVGVLHSMTGTMASNELPVIDATLFAIDELNQSGGLLGHHIQTHIRNGSSRETTFKKHAEELLQKPDTRALFGCWTSSSRKAVLPVVEKYNSLLFYPVQYEGIEQSTNVIYLSTTPNQQMIPALRWFKEKYQVSRIYFLGSDYIFPRTSNAVMRDWVEREPTLSVVGESYIPMGSTAIKQHIQRIREAKPDLIVNTINGDSNSAFFRALEKLNTTRTTPLPSLSFSVTEQDLAPLNGSARGHFAAWSYFQNISTESNTEFVRAFRARYGQHRTITAPMEAAYSGVHIWAKAVRKAKSFDPDKVRLALLGLSWQSPSGLRTINPRNQHTTHTLRVGEITEGGTFDVLWTSATTPPIPYPETRTKVDWESFLGNLYTSWGDRWEAPPP